MARQRKQAAKAEKPPGRKVTLLLSPQTDLLLSMSARIRGVDRSVRADKILEASFDGDEMLQRHLQAAIKGGGSKDGEAVPVE